MRIPSLICTTKTSDMNRFTALLSLLLAILFVGVANAQSRRGNVLSTFSNGNGDRFGATVSLSTDGTRIAVMAPDNGRLGTSNPLAEVYELQGGTWVRLGDTFTDFFESTPTEEATIELSGNGTTVATGEPAFNSQGGSDGGRIITYLYDNQGVRTVVANELSGTYSDAQLGKQIRLLENGTQLMTANFGGVAGDPRGAFNLVRGTQYTVVGTQPILQSTNEVAVSGIGLGRDGLRIAIGIDNGPDAPGAVQTFRFAGDWVSQGGVTGMANGDGFGASIALAENGNTAIVGAPNDGTGKVRVYDNTFAQIGSTLEGAATDQAFGHSVDISEDGFTIAIGAPANGLNATGGGRVYVYEFIAGDWALQNVFNGTMEDEQTGQSVSLSNDGMFLAIGRPGFEAAGQSDAGQVDVFILDGSSSVKEENLLDLQAFPNPVSSQLQIEGLPQGETIIFVRDAVGRLIMNETILGNTLDVSNLKVGSYFLEIRGDDGVGRIPFVKE